MTGTSTIMTPQLGWVQTCVALGRDEDGRSFRPNVVVCAVGGGGSDFVRVVQVTDASVPDVVEGLLLGNRPGSNGREGDLVGRDERERGKGVRRRDHLTNIFSLSSFVMSPTRSTTSGLWWKSNLANSSKNRSSEAKGEAGGGRENWQ